MKKSRHVILTAVILVLHVNIVLADAAPTTSQNGTAPTEQVSPNSANSDGSNQAGTGNNRDISDTGGG